MPKLSYVTFRGREDKMDAVANIFTNYLSKDVLDVGCDAKYLSKAVQGRYVGVDIQGSPDIQVNVESGLPFPNRSFDTVVAFDVLEHCDHIHFVFDELCRVSRSFLIIGLPNMYEWHFRVMFALGKNLGGKYGLPCDQPSDRHRWLFGLNQAMNFVQYRGDLNGFVLVDEALGYYSYQRALPKFLSNIGKRIAPKAASFFAYHYWAALKFTGETR